MLEINRRILYTVYEIKKQQAEESDKLKLEKLDKEKEDKNIVAILIDTKNFSVTYAVKDINDPNKHAEVVLLSKSDFQLQKGKNYMLISSLQPCKMCFGMISFRQLKYCFYLRDDSNANHHFSLDTSFPQQTFGGKIDIDEIERELVEEEKLLLNSFETDLETQYDEILKLQKQK